MLAKIAITLVFQCDQCFFEHRPAEYVDTHGSKVAAWFLRFLLKLRHTPCLICNHDPEAACFFYRNRHTGNRYICLICLVIIQHDFVIHFINMISRENQYIIRIVLLHIIQILKNCIGRPGIPFAVGTLFIWRKYGHTALVSVQIPRNTNADMGVQPQRLILCQNTDCIDS